MSANDNIPTREGQTPSREGPSGKERLCPICGKPRDKRYDPFCSRRCAEVDLHRWLKGGYVIPGGSVAREEGGEEE
jgi:endogenous inhibitor of DNA gyrase (YacG/DUF329 family)